MLLNPSSLVGVRVVARGLARGRRRNLSTSSSSNTSSVNKVTTNTSTSTPKQYNSCCCLLPNTTTSNSLERVSWTSSSSSSLSFSTEAEAGFCFAAAARADKIYPLQQRNFTNNHVPVRVATRSFGTNQKVSPFASSNASAKTIKDGKTTNRSTKKKSLFVPPKAAVKLTERSRSFLKQLLQSKIESEEEEQLNQSGIPSTNTTNKKTVGIMLRYEQASDGQPRMVFKFDFVSSHDIDPKMGDEGVSLEVLEDGITPKSPTDAWDDQLPKLYIHHGAFLKVLGATIDIEPNTGDIILFDKEGHRLDPNV